MTPLLLFGIAFLIRALVGALFADPAYPDSYYYANVARQLAAGNWFQVDYIWNFVDVGGRLPSQPVLPIPSNAHWMPLAALIQVPFIWLLGASPLAAGLPFWLVGAAAAPLAWGIGRDCGLSTPHAVAAGLLAAAPGGVTPFLSQPDNFGLFMTLGALALWLAARAMHGDRRALVVGGLVVGLATLARNDGVVLAVPFFLAALLDARRGTVLRRLGLRAAVASSALFLLVVAPWLVRQLAEFGSISPSAASGRILWITEYRELYSVSSETTLDSFLRQGLGPLLRSRIDGLVSAVTIFALWPLMAVLTPFVLIGAWLRRRDVRFLPFYVYAALLFALSALLFAVHVPHGTFIHSAVALVPHAFVLVVIGIAGTVRWVARRRRHWNVDHATAVFVAGAVVVALLGSSVRTYLTVADWRSEQAIREEIALALADVPPEDVVMSPDAGAYRYVATRRGIVTPDDPLPVIEDALRAYGVRWLILERRHTVEALAPVLLGESRPAWLSEPVTSVAPRQGAVLAGDPPPVDQPSAPAAALYAVCLAPSDLRCTP